MSLKKWTMFAAAAVALCVGVLVVRAWAPDRPLSELKARWAGAPSQFLAVEGLQAHVRDEGPRDDPRPLVLLHGTSASLHTWDGWTGVLAAHRRVIRVDLPGFGLTGPMPDGDYQLTHYARFVLALLDALKVPQAVLVGNSFGGSVAWKLAVDRPDRVASLVLIDSAGYAYQAQSVPLAFKLAQIPALAPVIGQLLPRSMVASSVRNVYAQPERVTEALIDRYFELSLAPGNRQALVERFKQSKGGEFAAQIALVKVPTLILWGEQDRLIPPAMALKFREDILSSQLVMLPGLGHVPHEEDPPASLAPVLKFLKQP